MFVGLGTVINIGTIILGTSIGIAGGVRFPDKLRILVTDILGCIVLVNAADNLRSVWQMPFTQAVPKGWTTLGTLASLILADWSLLDAESKSVLVLEIRVTFFRDL